MTRWSLLQVVGTGIRRTLRPLAGLALVAAMLLSGAAVAPADPAPAGHLRIGHLATGVGTIDVYLGGAVAARAVDFEQVSPYLALAPGPHTLAVRPTGAAPASTPLVSTTITVASDTVATVAIVADPGGLATHVYNDDLSAPPSGQAKLRVIQTLSGQPSVDIYAAPSTATDKAPSVSTENSGLTLSSPTQQALFSGAAYAAATPYAPVPAGTYDVQVRTTPGGQPLLTGRSWPVMAGTIATLVVLNGPSGPTLEVLRDAAGAAFLPAGGLPTGEGGTAGGTKATGPPPVGLALTGLVLAGALALAGSSIRAARGAHPRSARGGRLRRSGAGQV